MMYASLEQAGAQHSLPGRRSGDCPSMRLQGSQTRVNSRICGRKAGRPRRVRARRFQLAARTGRTPGTSRTRSGEGAYPSPSTVDWHRNWHPTSRYRLDSSLRDVKQDDSNNKVAPSRGDEQIDDVLDGLVGAVVGGFKSAVWAILRVRTAVEAAVGKWSAQPFVEEQK